MAQESGSQIDQDDPYLHSGSSPFSDSTNAMNHRVTDGTVRALAIMICSERDESPSSKQRIGSEC